MRKPYLTIGPSSHSSYGLFETGLRESLVRLRAHLLSDTRALRASPVRVYLMEAGGGAWRDLVARMGYRPIETVAGISQCTAPLRR